MSWIKDVQEEVRRLDRSEKNLRKFGWVAGVVFLLISAWMMFKNVLPEVRLLLLILSLLFLAAGFFFPRLLNPVYPLWMGGAFAMGWLVSRLILFILFYLVVTPVALVARISGKKFLDIKFKDGAESYWKSTSGQSADYEKMY